VAQATTSIRPPSTPLSAMLFPL
jgi:hypothetical protein